MPDWRRASDYQFPGALPAYRWAWEFLRRNPEYRADWQAALKRFIAGVGEFGEPVPYFEISTPEGERFVLSDGETLCRDPEDPEFYLEAEERGKWFLARGLFNPDIDTPKHLGLHVNFARVRYFSEFYPLLVQPAGLRHPWAVFDLALPLKPQIDAVARALKVEQRIQKIRPRPVRMHRTLWPLYLRLLDADLDGRTPKQVADALQYEIDGANEGKFWDQLQAAKKMTRPEGYLSILLSTEKLDS